MKTASMTRNKGQVYSVGNYLMTGKVLGKGHFARVEEATHRIIGKKVAIKIIDLTCIKEEYARRNLHREPRVMAKLRHPCIAALYETMMHGPRLYVVMEAAGGGDLCAHVLAARGAARGLPEARARALAAQLVSAVRHMHARGVVHRDLKMENIMLDSTKQFIKIVDFGLSNVWSASGGLRTPCGSLEYAAPELFVDGRRYGPEVDLWSVGVIVYGMVTGGLPFTGAEGGEARSRPQLRAAIARGFTRKQRAALACVSGECKTFIQHLLEPNVEQRMKIEEAARHRWVRRSGMRMKTHPLANVEAKTNREIYKQLSELCGQAVIDVVAQIKADPFGAIAGMYNIKTHLHQLQALPAADLLWSSAAHEPRPPSPPEYRPRTDRPEAAPPARHPPLVAPVTPATAAPPAPPAPPARVHGQNTAPNAPDGPSHQNHRLASERKPTGATRNAIESPKPAATNGGAAQVIREITNGSPTKVQTTQTKIQPAADHIVARNDTERRNGVAQSARYSGMGRPLSGVYGLKKPVYKMYDSGDCGLDRRLPSIDEHSNTDVNEAKKNTKSKITRTSCVRKVSLEDERPLRLNSCTNKVDSRRCEFYRRAGDGLPSWRASGDVSTLPARILLQSNATTIKRASLGNIVSPHSSSNSHCKSERAMPVGWYSSRNAIGKETTHLQRFRRTAPMK